MKLPIIALTFAGGLGYSFVQFVQYQRAIVACYDHNKKQNRVSAADLAKMIGFIEKLKNDPGAVFTGSAILKPQPYHMNDCNPIEEAYTRYKWLTICSGTALAVTLLTCCFFAIHSQKNSKDEKHSKVAKYRHHQKDPPQNVGVKKVYEPSSHPCKSILQPVSPSLQNSEASEVNKTPCSENSSTSSRLEEEWEKCRKRVSSGKV
jgi:hypothetical protein